MGIPFKMNLSDANKIFSEASSYFDHGTPLFKSRNDPNLPIFYDNRNTIKAHYLPFHSVNIKGLTTSYAGQYGINHYYTAWIIVNKKLTPVTRCEIYWYPIEGDAPSVNYPVGSKSTQILASFKVPRKYVEKIMSNTISDSNPLIDLSNDKNDFLPFEMKTNFALKLVTDRILEKETERVRAYVRNKYCADHVNISVTMHLDKADSYTIHSYYLPAFIYRQAIKTIGDLGKVYDPSDIPDESEVNIRYKILNAETKQLSGPNILSPFKIGGLTGGLVGISTIALLTPMAGPYGIGLTVAQILGRGALTMVLSGTFTGLMTRMTNSYKFWRDRDQILSDKEKNKNFQVQHHDKKMGYGYKQEVKGEEKTIPQEQKPTADPEKRYLHANLCYLLALDSLNPVSEKELREAYYAQVRKWYPDTYKGDKHMAELMTKEINEAYSMLLKQFKN